MSLGLQYIIQTVSPMDWHNKLQEKSLSTGICTLLPFISAESVHGTLGKGMRTSMILIFGMAQALLFQPRKNKENHYGFVWRMGAFKSVLFYLTFLCFCTITDHYHNSLIHYLLERFLYYTFCFLPL